MDLQHWNARESIEHLHSMLLRGDGTVLTWGSNLKGQLGMGRPTAVPEQRRSPG